jgi:peptidoglycan/xylan/chitin deacetylase (PgdA/CDA1 family)
MKKKALVAFIAFLAGCLTVSAQRAADYLNGPFLDRLNKDASYTHLKATITAEFIHAQPGNWGEFVRGVDEDIKTGKKIIAFTFDACGGPKGSGYDAELIDFLRKEHVPATLFVTGKWIDANFSTFLTLSKDTLFEIENHGLNHRPCALDGESEYGIHGTANAASAFDEVEANARKIEALTHRRPVFYRSATAFIDEACARMTEKLGIQTISFQILSGDAVPYTPAKVIERNVIDHVSPGAIVIMHFNRPAWNTCEAMRLIVPQLRKMGYQFVKLEHFKLVGKAVRRSSIP